MQKKIMNVLHVTNMDPNLMYREQGKGELVDRVHSSSTNLSKYR